MPSERVQRQIDRFLDDADAAMAADDWELVRQRADAVLRLDANNEDAQTYLKAARGDGSASPVTTPQPGAAEPAFPSAFAGRRYEVREFLGEGGKKRVFLAHDSLLDREVAFALIRTEGLDDAGRERITREAQAMARLGETLQDELSTTRRARMHSRIADALERPDLRLGRRGRAR